MANKKRTRGTLVHFPSLPGNPEDPNLPAISEALRSCSPQATDAECRTFAREFAAAQDRLEKDTLGMTDEQRCEYQVERLMEIMIDVYMRSGASREEAIDTSLKDMEFIAKKVGAHRQSMGLPA